MNRLKSFIGGVINKVIKRVNNKIKNKLTIHLSPRVSINLGLLIMVIFEIILASVVIIALFSFTLPYLVKYSKTLRELPKSEIIKNK